MNTTKLIISISCLLGKKQETDELSGDAAVEDDSLVKVMLLMIEMRDLILGTFNFVRHI